MKWRHFVMPCVMIAWVAGCGNKRSEQSAVDCYQTVPDTVAGLKVQGPRSRQNVIENMVPAVCAMRELYEKRRQQTALSPGVLTLTMTIDPTGEIGAVTEEHTFSDTAFVRECMHILYSRDFDPWLDQEDAEVVYPIRIGK
jgi:hypothetical protein